MESLRRKNLNFDPIPKGDPYLSINMERPVENTASGHTWSSSIVSVIASNEVPLDMLSTILSEGISLENTLGKIIHREPAIAVCILLGLTAGVVTPFAGLIFCICRTCRKRQPSSVNDKNHCFFCYKRIFTFGTYSLVLLLLAGYVAILLNKELLETSMKSTEFRLKNNIQDLETFVRNSRAELKFLMENSLDRATAAFYSDLDDIEYYLGRSLQREFVEMSHLEDTLSSIIKINEGFRTMGGRLKSIESIRQETAKKEEEFSNRLKILKVNIDTQLKKCSTMDQLLCETIDTSGLIQRTSFHNISLTKLLEVWNRVESQNLTEFALRIKNKFGSIPTVVATSSYVIREDIKRHLRERRSTLLQKLNQLGDASQKIEVKISNFKDTVGFFTGRLIHWTPITRSIGLGVAFVFGLILLVQSVASILTCCVPSTETSFTKSCNPRAVTGVTLKSSVVLIFLVSCLLWFVSVCILLLGTQAQIFVCQPLREEPKFSTLTQLLDKGGILFPVEGAISYFLDTKTDTNIEIRHILNSCREDRASYSVFNLKDFFDLDSELVSLRNFNLTEKLLLTKLQLVPLNSEDKLGQILQSININLSFIRREMEQPLLDVNIHGLVSQLQRVAGQLQSAETSAELFRLVTQARYFIAAILDPMEKRKEDLTYRVIALDAEVIPLQRKINESAEHLRKFYEYIRLRGPGVMEDKITEYSNGLHDYFCQFSEHVQQAAVNDVAKCSPVWRLFDSARSTVCGDLVHPITSIGIASYVCLLVLLLTIYFNLKLAAYYSETATNYQNEGDPVSIVQPTNNLWVTPGLRRGAMRSSFSEPRIGSRLWENDRSSTHWGTSIDQQQDYKEGPERRRLSLGRDRSPSYNHVPSSCSPRCSNHFNAVTNSLLLPHLMSGEDLHVTGEDRRETSIAGHFDSSPCDIPAHSSLLNLRDIHSPEKAHQDFSKLGLKGAGKARSHSVFSPQRPYSLYSQVGPVESRTSRRRLSTSADCRTSVENERIFRPIQLNLRSGKSSRQVGDERLEGRDGPAKIRSGTSPSNEAGRDVVAMAQVTAWREAALAGAKFVTPEFVAIQVRKSPSWVKKFWDLDPRTLANSAYYSHDLRPTSGHNKMSLMCVKTPS